MFFEGYLYASVRGVEELDEVRVLAVLGGEGELDAGVGANLVALGHALGHRLLHHHLLGHVALLHRAGEALLAHRLVLEHLPPQVGGIDGARVIGILRHVGLRLRDGLRRVGAELLGHLLHHSGHRAQHLLAGGLLGALQKPIGNDHALLAGNLALFVAEPHRQRFGLHQGKRCHLLGRVGEDGLMMADSGDSLARIPHALLVHEGGAALQQDDPEVARALRLVGGLGIPEGMRLGIGHLDWQLQAVGHARLEAVALVPRRRFIVGPHRRAARNCPDSRFEHFPIGVSFEIHHQQIAGRGLVRMGQLPCQELAYLLREAHERAPAMEVRPQLLRQTHCPR